MPVDLKLNRPWLVAVWPGMGGVSISAGYYLMAKLDMHVLTEFSPRELFEVEHVEVRNGLIRPGRMPRSRLFVGRHQEFEHDIVVFIGEAQPTTGKYAICKRLVDLARELGVERVFTFAAMATGMSPDAEPRVFAAATDESGVAELRETQLEILEDGQIGGLNGVLLGVAAECGLRGACLLGEMPQVFAQFPFPKASLVVLESFTKLAGISIDLAELTEQAQQSQQQLKQFLAQVERAVQERIGGDEAEQQEDEAYASPPVREGWLSSEEEQEIERLFEEARQDRSKAYRLKHELDRLDVFHHYEDRFLDLFKKSE